MSTKTPLVASQPPLSQSTVALAEHQNETIENTSSNQTAAVSDNWQVAGGGARANSQGQSDFEKVGAPPCLQVAEFLSNDEKLLYFTGLSKYLNSLGRSENNNPSSWREGALSRYLMQDLTRLNIEPIPEFVHEIGWIPHAEMREKIIQLIINTPRMPPLPQNQKLAVEEMYFRNHSGPFRRLLSTCETSFLPDDPIFGPEQPTVVNGSVVALFQDADLPRREEAIKNWILNPKTPASLAVDATLALSDTDFNKAHLLTSIIVMKEIQASDTFTLPRILDALEPMKGGRPGEEQTSGVGFKKNFIMSFLRKNGNTVNKMDLIRLIDFAHKNTPLKIQEEIFYEIALSCRNAIDAEVFFEHLIKLFGDVNRATSNEARLNSLMGGIYSVSQNTLLQGKVPEIEKILQFIDTINNPAQQKQAYHNIFCASIRRASSEHLAIMVNHLANRPNDELKIRPLFSVSCMTIDQIDNSVLSAITNCIRGIQDPRIKQQCKHDLSRFLQPHGNEFDNAVLQAFNEA